ncbi:MAG: hypothetical protein HKM98_00975 [Gammaproteobacteria bacterium]|nr:hypothetical protein [Gammaproteobacteria bacterium]
MNRSLIVVAFLAIFCSNAHAQSPAAELYQSALSQAEEGEHELALDTLEQAVTAGFRGLSQLQSDASLQALRDRPRFKQLVASVRDKVFPCERGARHREFDFWLGTWDVYTADANIAGRNRISKAENGCVLVELWTGNSGVTGRSINFYDASKDKWRQHWVSATGLLIDIEGNLVDGSMVLEGSIFYPATELEAGFRGKWTLLEDGRVRQFFEQHDAEKDAWNPWFEGYYEKISQ